MDKEIVERNHILKGCSPLFSGQYDNVKVHDAKDDEFTAVMEGVFGKGAAR